MATTGLSVRSFVVSVVLLALIGVLVAPAGHAGDVPSGAQKEYDKAKGYAAKGDEKSLKRAWSALTKIRDSAARSVDFWTLYVQVGRALDKEEESIWSAVAKREEANPTCPAFDLVRYRFATSLEERRKHVAKALEKAPDDIDLKLLKVAVLIEAEEEFDAEELVDEILEARPDEPKAIVMKGRLQLIQGYSNAAIELADEHLAKTPLAGLHHLKAQAYFRMHTEDGKETLDDALGSAEAAVGMEAAPEYVVTLARVLETKGDFKKAKETVKKYFDDDPSPLLAALLGEYAFAVGDYATAIPALKASAKSEGRSARGLAECYTRLGDEKKALAALELALKHAPDDAVFRSQILANLGKYEEALAALEGSEDESAPFARVWSLAELGRPADIKAEALKRIDDGGGLAAEWTALCWARGRVIEAMGANAAGGVRTKMRKVEIAKSKADVASPEPDEDGVTLKADTLGFIQTVPIYVLSACGTRFQAYGDAQPNIIADPEAGTITISIAIWGKSECGRDEFRRFMFNPSTSSGDSIKIDFPGGDFGEAQSAFGDGLKKLLGGDNPGAMAEFDKALGVEPNWHMPKVFRGVAKALSSEADRKTAAKEILAVLEEWPDDFLARRLAILIGAWAKDDVDAAIDSLLEREEAYSERRLDEL